MNKKSGKNEGKEPGRLFTITMNNVIVASCTLATRAEVEANVYLPSLQKRLLKRNLSGFFKVTTRALQ